ncbi:hypothetical protein [Variovorax sp. YR216]|uniref:hypothetical protein n=1 Tax=Variovorax sp. YR216 TaxID=1882828 RepID=UPI0008978FA7|nr:hypothetical protein [Variovorax sp. YR216]SEA73514.1 hypothetical protein SAMN05444680_103335 [Variovorax sp. YR216]
MRFEEIVFMDDCFRSPDNLVASHPANRRFLRRTFGLPARRLGIPCRDICARSEGGTLDVPTMMRTLGLSQSPAGWARSCVADLAPLVDAGLVPRLGAGTLVIGWGLTPSLMHWLDRQGTSFIDVEISPRRFASHLAFCVRTNDRRIQTALSDWEIDDETYWNEATALKGYFARRGASNLFGADLRIGLFCGQTVIDLALVQEGEIARPADVSEAVKALAERVDLLVVKPHPYEPDQRHLRALSARIPNVAWSEANIYSLLCADNLEFVCSLSSGALLEASYFAKESIPLIEADRNNRAVLPASCSEWMTVGPGIASIECMASLCADSPNSAPKASSYPGDALDRAFRARWGLDAQNPGLPDLPALEASRDHTFRDQSLPPGWLTLGWHDPAPAGAAAKGPFATIVIPLRPGSWPVDTAPLVEINGKPYRDGKFDFRLSAHLNDRRNPRAVVLEFDFAQGKPGFWLQHLRVAPARQSPRAGRRATASSAALTVVTAIVCALGVMKLVSTNTDPIQASSDWTQIQKVVASRVDAMRDDIHVLLQHHI